ncbi:Uncharacterized protein PECH_004854 [Penicillium ucsense]|uniref:Mcm2 3 5 family protein n=1 Tax=Penicillium ucsense TaxID=2839758 RepID=A0A8J8WN74_9EURO|nr:Uncharacterized protein PECM_006959 [Penicillium ucsense]KAF7736789.1 Uncharacterized protein PECH_004854 [Penicillium ucsense]
MSESRDPRRSLGDSLLSSDEEVGTAKPQRPWNPLGGRETPTTEYAYLPPTDNHGSFSEEVLREVGLGITETPDEALHHHEETALVSKEQPSSIATAEEGSPTLCDSPAATRCPQSPRNCPTRATVLQSRFSWIPVTIFVLALYATVFSGIYLGIAIRKPRWDSIGSQGSLAPSTANLLCALFAKTIELAYVTICVAFLGQVLSRRALMKDSRGISISDMNMRAWIMQPGSMLVHWETLRYSALTFLGAIALVATFVAMMYTTAAEALDTKLSGKIQTSFANVRYLALKCQSPIPRSMDEASYNETCLQILHAGQSYHNYEQWISSWANLQQRGGSASTRQTDRPKPTGSMWDNTTLSGSWIEVQDMAMQSKTFGRMINNITMAMPHGGIPIAAMDADNKISQPQDASGEGKYVLKASVPSPAVNVLCVGMNETELAPLVYNQWPNSNFDASTWSFSPPDDIPVSPSLWNKTVVDDIFGFGEKYNQQPPIFGKLPMAYNTILNTTGRWPTSSIYLVGHTSVSHPQYVMCGMRAKLTGVCSTQYTAASSGASLSTNCENGTDFLRYDRFHNDFVEGTWQPDWKNVADVWASALSLGSGITDGQASNERLLMQLMPAYDPATNTYSLNSSLPTVGEALAVMAGSTLILSSQDSPFVHYYEYNQTILPTPERQSFQASLQAVGYASGGTERWQGVFYVILIFAFLTSFICLAFVILEARGHQITDFTEPQNLFAIAVNSPPSSQIHGACGGGPVGPQMKERWHISMEEADAHYYIHAENDNQGPFGSPRTTAYQGLGQMDIEDSISEIKPVSPAVNEFRRVSKRSSLLAKLY